MNALPSNLPSVANARLPATYETARTALAECSRIDECADWANKADALASYAKQAGDETLYKTAMRIRDRAIRRCGELLKQYDGKGNNQHRDGAVPIHRAAEQAGLSERQRKTALRVANIPHDDFEEQVESDDPPTLTELAKQGTAHRPDHLDGIDPAQFSAATHTKGAMRRFAEKCSEHDAAYIAGGLSGREIKEARDLVAVIDAWLDRFVVNLKG